MNQEIKLPDPDTHCWDDDSSKDVWSYSPELVRQIIKADREQRGEPTSLSGQGAVIHGQLVAAVQRLLQSQNEPERFGCVGPSPSEIAYRNLIHLIQHACAGIDSPPSQPERKPMPDNEMNDLAFQCGIQREDARDPGVEEFARAIEAFHGIKP